MNRRNFLKSIGKICAVLPFVGSSSAVAQSGASEGAPKASWDKLGCKDCFRDCGQFDICEATLKKKVSLDKTIK